MIDGGIVALEGLPGGLLVAPANPRHEASDMVPVVRDAEGGADHFGDAGGRPQIGAIAIGESAFEKNLDETFFLPHGEFWRTSGNRFGLEPVFPALRTRVTPAHDGARMASDFSRDFVQ